jgi:integrase
MVRIDEPDETLGLSTEQKAVKARAREVSMDAIAVNTKKAYKSDLTMFARWCDRTGFSAMPASPSTVAAYLVQLGEGTAFPDEVPPILRKASTISRHATSISVMHQFKKFPSPCVDEEVKRALKAIRRQKGTRPAKKEAVLTDVVRRMVDACRSTVDEDHPELQARINVMNRSILLLGFGSACRRSEIAALNLGDIDVVPEGLILLIRKSKGDQEGKGRYVRVIKGIDIAYCPQQTYLEWLEIRKSLAVPSEAVFVSLTNRSKFKRIIPEVVARIVKTAALQIGLNPKLFAGHSLRRGHVTVSGRAGVSPAEIQEQTGHKDMNTLMGYFEKDKSWEKASGRGLLL